MSESVPLFPNVTPDIQQQIENVLLQRETADYECYLLLRRAVNWIGCKPCREEKEDVADLKEEIRQVLKERERHNDKFLKLVSGH